MTIKMYISSTCGNKEMKKHQMKAQLIMESKGIDYRIVDIADPIQEDDKKFMQENAKPRVGKYPLPPQFFNETVWCGDYESFDEANETDTLEEFLKLPVGSLNQNILKPKGNAEERVKESSPVHPVSNGDARLSEERQVDGEHSDKVLDGSQQEPVEESSNPVPPEEEVPSTDQPQKEEDEEEEEEESEEEEEEDEE